MTPKQSEKVLAERLTAGGKKLEQLGPAEGIAAMLAFYAERRADGCEVDEDGDMLLFQWGVSESGDGETFRFDITRQFLPTDQDEPQQLSLVFHFEPSTRLRRIESDNEWCHSPDDLPRFRQFVMNSPPYRAVESERPKKVELSLNQC